MKGDSRREVIARNPLAESLLVGDRSPHLGLVFERFPRLLMRSGAAGGFELPEGARRTWLQEFVDDRGLAKKTPVRRTRLETVHSRLDDLARRCGGERREFRTSWRFATGLGNPSATDIGFAFDAACGVPSLPGTAVKGLARAGAELASAQPAQIAEILGKGPEGDEPGNAGTVVFLDALPLHWPKLEVDVITRHHDPEALATQATPLDADKPNPVHFLTVAPEQVFVFRLLPRRGASSGALELAWQWLTEALQSLGAGAKTAVGYGQMEAVARGG